MFVSACRLLLYEQSVIFHSHNFFIAGLVSVPLGRINKFHSQLHVFLEIGIIPSHSELSGLSAPAV